MKRLQKNKFEKINVQSRKNNLNNSSAYGVLPAPSILESYEEVSPGSVKKILEMAALEQEHRHKWENNYLRVMGYNNRVGQLLAFILAIIIIYISIALIMSHNVVFACITLIIGFAFLITLILSSTYSKHFMNKPKKTDVKKN